MLAKRSTRQPRIEFWKCQIPKYQFFPHSICARDSIEKIQKMVVHGQTAAMLLGRFYFDKGGQSMWISTFVQTVAFPVLLLAFIAIPSSTTTSSTDVVTHASIASLAFVYISIGLIIIADNLMYSYGLLYLPISTYSLASVHLASYSLLIGASAVYSLILSFIQLSFEKVIMKIEYSAVIEMQFYTSAIATIASVIGLFGSREWKSLPGEMRGFESGKFSYVMTLVGRPCRGK
ncbi:hypothetical protein ZOSMA_381G00240 [Zostera marina]|uniref:Uncharacterized protein n=1 Tax=Zostera marina TaxID=29655 RepID=A0A0K9P7E0_ZOSMR|nr:hypothetical protein ZOSMA_381G00240 [Zostera marina]